MKVLFKNILVNVKMNYNNFLVFANQGQVSNPNNPNPNFINIVVTDLNIDQYFSQDEKNENYWICKCGKKKLEKKVLGGQILCTT